MIVSDKIKKIAVEISRLLLGCLFIFSGFVKAVDPLGGTYKFKDYFAAFGMESLNFMALPASVFLSAFEFTLGVCILLAVYRRLAATLSLLFMLFMTALTLYLAIKNPVVDCGCFGDALVITNWETFYKNIVLLIASLIVFFWNRFMWRIFNPSSSWLVKLYTYLFIVGVSFYCYQNLPILDFRPYKIGANIPAQMHVPEGAPHDEYTTTLIYAKDGQQKEFTLENYPANDSSWVFVEQKNELIKKGFKAPIHDFTITKVSGEEITDIVLADTSYTFLLIASKLQKADDSRMDEINKVYEYARQYGYNFYCLTASLSDEIEEWTRNTAANYEFCTTDEITLKTIIRSNPGLLLLKKGVIINKWPCQNIPAFSNNPLNNSSLGIVPENNDKKEILCSVLILALPLCLIALMEFLFRKKQNTNVKPESGNC